MPGIAGKCVSCVMKLQVGRSGEGSHGARRGGGGEKEEGGGGGRHGQQGGQQARHQRMRRRRRAHERRSSAGVEVRAWRARDGRRDLPVLPVRGEGLLGHSGQGLGGQEEGRVAGSGPG
jgi:hypothetical protein